MPDLKGPLENEGALVEVLLGWSASRVQKLRAALKPVPPALQARALLDTGAEVTCVDAALIQLLGLPFGGTAAANLPAHGGLTFGALHDVGLTILHPSGKSLDHLIVPNLSVLELPISFLGYQVLIGRDVLARCVFLYNGQIKKFRLKY